MVHATLPETVLRSGIECNTVTIICRVTCISFTFNLLDTKVNTILNWQTAFYNKICSWHFYPKRLPTMEKWNYPAFWIYVHGKDVSTVGIAKSGWLVVMHTHRQIALDAHDSEQSTFAQNDRLYYKKWGGWWSGGQMQYCNSLRHHTNPEFLILHAIIIL